MVQKTETISCEELKIQLSTGVIFFKESSILEYNLQKASISNTLICINEIVKILEYVEICKPQNLLINSIGNTLLFHCGLKGWFENVVLFQLKRCNIKNIAFVVDESVIKLKKNISDEINPVNLFFFDNYVVAFLWLTTKN